MLIVGILWEPLDTFVVISSSSKRFKVHFGPIKAHFGTMPVYSCLICGIWWRDCSFLGFLSRGVRCGVTCLISMLISSFYARYLLHRVGITSFRMPDAIVACFTSGYILLLAIVSPSSVLRVEFIRVPVCSYWIVRVCAYLCFEGVFFELCNWCSRDHHPETRVGPAVALTNSVFLSCFLLRMWKRILGIITCWNMSSQDGNCKRRCKK